MVITGDGDMECCAAEENKQGGSTIMANGVCRRCGRQVGSLTEVAVLDEEPVENDDDDSDEWETVPVESTFGCAISA